MNWDFTNDSHIEVIDSVTIQGYRFSDGWARDQHVYFRTRFSKPFTAVQMDTTATPERRKTNGYGYHSPIRFRHTKTESKYLSTQPFPVSAWKEQLKIWQPKFRRIISINIVRLHGTTGTGNSLKSQSKATIRTIG